MVGMGLAGLINEKSQVFKKMTVDLSKLGDADIIRLIEENPRIIIRPLLSDGQRVLLGFNEHDYIEFID